jgi:DNA-binding SARP family transcriptional activator
VELYHGKSKKLLAYFADRRGAACNALELCAALWEDEHDSSVVRNLIYDLTHMLEYAAACYEFIRLCNS